MLTTPDIAQTEMLNEADVINREEFLADLAFERIEDGLHNEELLEALMEAKESDTKLEIMNKLAKKLAKELDSEDF